jgi:hypothetical protein
MLPITVEGGTNYPYILKPGKPPNKLTSYRTMSLLPVVRVSEVFEKLLQKKLLVPVENNKSVPNHQF